MGAMKVVAIALALWPGVALAGGFFVPEIGGRAVGMAGAMTAEAADPSTIFHNPAGLTALPGVQVQLSGDLVLPDVANFRRPVTDPASGGVVNFASVSNSNRLAGVPFLGASFDLG